MGFQNRNSAAEALAYAHERKIIHRDIKRAVAKNDRWFAESIQPLGEYFDAKETLIERSDYTVKRLLSLSRFLMINS